jgi:hypothetical protein
MVRSVVGRENGEQPDTLVIMGAQVAEGVRGQGLAGRVLTELKNLAASRSWDKVIAPVRPTLKSSYPLVDIKRFVTWTQEDGGPLDPWLRTHWRMGARVLSCAPASQTMTGTVAEWERWTGLALPETGDYVIPEGLSVLRIDQEKDEGRYVEPNVWMRHC